LIEFNARESVMKGIQSNDIWQRCNLRAKFESRRWQTAELAQGPGGSCPFICIFGQSATRSMAINPRIIRIAPGGYLETPPGGWALVSCPLAAKLFKTFLCILIIHFVIH